MRLATGATHERDTREKAPVFLRRGLTQEAAPSPLSFERRLISATSFIRNARSGIHISDAEKISVASAIVTPISFVV